MLRCHACAARDRKAYNRNASRERDDPPPFGEFFAVTPETVEDVGGGEQWPSVQ